MKSIYSKIFGKDNVSLNPFTLKFGPVFMILQLFILYTYLASSAVWVNQYIALTPYYYMVFLCVFILFFTTKQKTIRMTQRFYILIALCVLYCFVISRSVNLLSAIAKMMEYLIAVILLFLDRRYQRYLLTWITKTMSFIIGISILIYILLFFVSLPAFGTFIAANDFYAPFNNYIFFLQSTNIVDVFRFNGPFLEPGHLGIVSTFLLYANKFRFREQPYLWILLAAVIISFSLSGWMLTLIGFLFVRVHDAKTLVISAVCVSAMYLFAVNYNEGDNYINSLVVERMEYDEDKGIKGNNRFSTGADRYYEVLRYKGKLAWGVGDSLTWKDVQGAGYKMYFIHYGYVSAFVVLMMYWFMLPPGKKDKYQYGFLILIVVCFMSRSYPNWYSWLLPFVLATNLEGRKQNADVSVASSPCRSL